jgi:hypothetical protein
VSVEYLDPADFLVIAEEVTGINVQVLSTMSSLSLADSADLPCCREPLAARS